MFVYLDETTFGDKNQFCGYGSLICKSPVQNKIILEALKNLELDPDSKKSAFIKSDVRTLNRKFFHAADDSQNAHSHLCTAINKHTKGEFQSHYFKTREHSFKNTEEAYSLASMLSTMGVFTDSKKVTFIFEERNDLTTKSIEEWWASMWNDLLGSQYKAPFVRTYHPELDFRIGNKSDPGLQVVDFILWSSTRKIIGKKCPWFDRLEPWLRTQVKPESGTWGGYSLNFGYEGKIINDTYSIEDYLHDDENLNSSNMLPVYIVNVQNVINLAASINDKSDIQHFYQDISFLKLNCVKKGGAEHIRKMAQCFLKLFDNLEIVSDETPQDEKSFWLSCRMCFSLALRTNEIEGRLHANRLSKLRNQIILSEPNLLRDAQSHPLVLDQLNSQI